MGSTTSFLIVVFGYLTFGISAIIWISKKKKAGEKISLWAKIIIATIFLSNSSILLSFIELPPTPEKNISETSTYYVKAKNANVRECPSTSCKVIDSLLQNTPLIFPGDLFNKYPDWVEVVFSNGENGYVSKTTLSENIVPESQLVPIDDSSSVGGITIGPWANIQAVVGESYEIPFCEPPSTISGATCGALADTTTDPRGGTPPYSFIKKSGFLPPGMMLELNGTLRGSPTQEGTYNFRLCAKDLYGGEGCQNLAVMVKKAEEISIEETPVYVPTQIQDEKIAGATRDVAECKFLYTTKNPYGDLDHPTGYYYYDYFDVNVSGNVTGPVGTNVGFTCSNNTERNADGTVNETILNVPSWTQSGYVSNFVRGPGDPETTAWSCIRKNHEVYRTTLSFEEAVKRASIVGYRLPIGPILNWDNVSAENKIGWRVGSFYKADNFNCTVQ